MEMKKSEWNIAKSDFAKWNKNIRSETSQAPMKWKLFEIYLAG